jgi:hypothetical protein
MIPAKPIRLIGSVAALMAAQGISPDPKGQATWVREEDEVETKNSTLNEAKEVKRCVSCSCGESDCHCNGPRPEPIAAKEAGLGTVDGINGYTVECYTTEVEPGGHLKVTAGSRTQPYRRYFSEHGTLVHLSVPSYMDYKFAVETDERGRSKELSIVAMDSRAGKALLNALRFAVNILEAEMQADDAESKLCDIESHCRLYSG